MGIGDPQIADTVK